MRIAVAADERTGVADAVVEELRRRGHETIAHGALSDGERDDWAWASEAAARDVAEGRAEQAVVCCWTGTGASIAANKVGGIRAALCGDGPTAGGARRWNDANVLALSLRATSEAELAEILDAWFGGEPSPDADDRANVEHLAEIERPDGGVAVRRLLPDPGETTPQEQYTGLRLGEKAPGDRPYVASNFAVTLDGRVTIQGRAGPIGTRTDMEVLHLLRTQVDAVMIGAGTMRAECYGRLVPDPALRGLRERGEGLAHDPLAVIVTRTLDLPWECELFSGGWGRVLIAAASDEDLPELATSTRVMRFTDRVDLGELLRRLRTERGVRSLLCEGGPHTHGQLVELELIDELFVTTAPKLAGGSGPGLLEGALEQERPLEQVWLCEDSGGELYTRYRVAGDD